MEGSRPPKKLICSKKLGEREREKVRQYSLSVLAAADTNTLFRVVLRCMVMHRSASVILYCVIETEIVLWYDVSSVFCVSLGTCVSEASWSDVFDACDMCVLCGIDALVTCVLCHVCVSSVCVIDVRM